MSFFKPVIEKFIDRINTATFDIQSQDISEFEFFDSKATIDDPDLYQTYEVSTTRKLFGKSSSESSKTYIIKYEDKEIRFKWSYFVLLKAIDKKIWVNTLREFAVDKESHNITLGEFKGVKMARIAYNIFVIGLISSCIIVAITWNNNINLINKSNFETKTVDNIKSQIPKGESELVASKGDPVEVFTYIKSVTSGRRFSKTTSFKLAGYVLCKDYQTTKTYVVQAEDEKLFDFATIKEDQPYNAQNLQKDICNKTSNAIGLDNIANENKSSTNELLQKTSLQNLQDPLVFFPDYEVLVFTPITKIITVTVPFLLLLIPGYFWYKARKQKYEVINKILEITK